MDSCRTALILGCEFRCKDAVEVLLKSGADVKAVDSLGHDAFHYARLSQNPELTELVKNYLEKATKGQTSLCQRLLDTLDLPNWCYRFPLRLDMFDIRGTG